MPRKHFSGVRLAVKLKTAAGNAVDWCTGSLCCLALGIVSGAVLGYLIRWAAEPPPVRGPVSPINFGRKDVTTPVKKRGG